MNDITEFEEVVFDYLDNLRDSGITNMFGAGPYVEAKFGMTKSNARSMLSKWMKTFGERHPND